MTIIDVYDELRSQLLTIGLNTYKEIKPASETGNCIVLNSVPILKDNTKSIVDIVIILYLNKKNGQFDGFGAKSLFPLISQKISDFVKDNSYVLLTERLEPETLNLDDRYTTTQFAFRTIIYNN